MGDAPGLALPKCPSHWGAQPVISWLGDGLGSAGSAWAQATFTKVSVDSQGRWHDLGSGAVSVGGNQVVSVSVSGQWGCAHGPRHAAQGVGVHRTPCMSRSSRVPSAPHIPTVPEAREVCVAMEPRLPLRGELCSSSTGLLLEPHKSSFCPRPGQRAPCPGVAAAWGRACPAEQPPSRTGGGCRSSIRSWKISCSLLSFSPSSLLLT